MLAILADFKGENPKTVAEEIVRQIIALSRSGLDTQRYMKQLRIFGNLRNLIPVNSVIMDNLTKYILEETDIESDVFYQRGEKKGLKRGLEKGITEGLKEKSLEVVKNLLSISRFGIEEIAHIAGVPEEFVLQVQESLQ
jgi:predicted transposase YdaD